MPRKERKPVPGGSGRLFRPLERPERLQLPARRGRERRRPLHLREPLRLRGCRAKRGKPEGRTSSVPAGTDAEPSAHETTFFGCSTAQCRFGKSEEKMLPGPSPQAFSLAKRETARWGREGQSPLHLETTPGKSEPEKKKKMPDNREVVTCEKSLVTWLVT